jgi:hypothetical protein
MYNPYVNNSYYNMLSGIASLYGAPRQYNYGAAVMPNQNQAVINQAAQQVPSGGMINPAVMPPPLTSSVMPSVEPINEMAPPVTQMDSNMGGLDQPMTSAVMPSGYLRSEPDSMMNPGAYPSGGTMPVAQTGGTLDYGQPGYGGTGFGAYGMGRTSNPYTIGTGGTPYTSPYFRGFNNPYSGGFGGKGGMARPSYGIGKGGQNNMGTFNMMSSGQTYQPYTPSSGHAKGGANAAPPGMAYMSSGPM